MQKGKLKMKSVMYAPKKLSIRRAYSAGKKLLKDPFFQEGQRKSYAETLKTPTRTEVINLLLSHRSGPTRYLEIGVRNPDDNYNHIVADEKYSVDPGVEYKENPVDFKVTSDEFFDLLSQNEILSSDIQFDVIFIDGLHLAEQVDKDIVNALKFVKSDGFVVLHDCNPPTEWHARENFYYRNTPAAGYWNGTTWKAFLKWRSSPTVNSCCIDSDWGVGILSKDHPIGLSIDAVNLFYEFSDFDMNRSSYLGLISFDELKKRLRSLG